MISYFLYMYMQCSFLVLDLARGNVLWVGGVGGMLKPPIFIVATAWIIGFGSKLSVNLLCNLASS